MSRYISPVLYILLMLVGCVAFAAIAGVRVGFIEPATAFVLLRKTVYAALALTGLTLVSLVVCRRERSAGGKRFFILVAIVSFIYSMMWVVVYMQKAKLPDLYDITTDLVSPPVFININYIRKASEHDVLYRQEWADIQKKYYPNVKPLIVSSDFKQAYIEVVSLIHDKGWDVVAQYPNAGVVEATARTPVFGMRNDVVVRLIQQDNGVRIDMRSSSRMGKSDHGDNAERIKNFMRELSSRLDPIPMSINFRN